MNCQYCSARCIKAGKQSNGKQKYYCKRCAKYQQESYSNAACLKQNKELYYKCLKEGMSLRGLQRITRISISTQLRCIRMLKFTNATCQIGDTYEVDELCTYVKNKKNRRWVISAISKNTGKVLAVKVGTRSLKNIIYVVNSCLAFFPKAIYTDRLNLYKSAIPNNIHKVKPRGINKIERYHLNLRTHIKRLNRRTICYSKQEDILEKLILIQAFLPR